MRKLGLGSIVFGGLLFFCLTGFSLGQSTSGLVVDQNGNVGIGTASPGAKLDVNGDVHINGTLSATNISGGANFVPPSLSNFTWLNQGGATATQQGDAIVLVVPPNNGHSARSLIQPAPPPPYTITVYIDSVMMLTSPSLVSGIVLYNSSSGKLVTFCFGTYTGIPGCEFVALTHWNSATSMGSDIGYPSMAHNGSLWLRIKDDGTNRTALVSRDGINFMQIFSVANTDWMVPDMLGIYSSSGSSAYGIVNTIRSFQVTTP